jgi:Bacterial Ig-like domain (group 3)/Divergent InlB B-repeat domain
MFRFSRRALRGTLRVRRIAILGSLLALVALAAFAFTGTAAPTCTDSWNNASGGSWSTASNWSTGVVPGGSDVACITLAGNYTVTLQGGQPEVSSLILGSSSGSTTQVLAVQGVTGVNSSLSFATDSTIAQTGQLVLDSQTGSSSGSASVVGASTATLTNDGSIVTQVESTNNHDYLEANLTNAAGATVEVKSGELRQDHATTTTNDGTWTVDAAASPGYTLTTSSASFVNAAGTVVNDGSITTSGGASWTQSGGSESGNPVKLTAGSLSDTGTGSGGSFEIENTVSLSGTIAANETVSVIGTTGINGIANAGSGLVNNGTLVLDSQTGASSGYALLEGGPVTNNGTIDSQVESSNNIDYLEANLTNSSTGMVEVKSGELRQDHATTTTNDGTWMTDVGASPGYTLTTSSALFVNAAGTVINDGAITTSGGASWSQSGGAESGNPVKLTGGSLSDNGKGTGGSFEIQNTVAVSGTIAAAETVTLAAATGLNAVADAASGLVNNGTIVLDSQAGSSSGYANLEGTTVTNNGTIDSQVESTNNLDYLEANLTNSSTGTVEIKSGVLRQDHATTTTNGGDVIVDVPGAFDLTNGSALFTEQSTGTLTFDISSATTFGTINCTGGATFSLSGGTADPVLQSGYAPPVGTEFDVITGPHGAGTFTKINNNFTGDYAHTGYIGLVRAPDGTTASVASSLNPAGLGTSVTLTATVTPDPGGVGNPTGTVTFFDNGTSIGTGAVSTTNGVTTATLKTSSLTVGTHPITVSYGGDSNYKASGVSSPALDQVIGKASSGTSVGSSKNPSTDGQSVTFTATVTGVSGGTAPTGTVTFYDNGSQIGTGGLSTTAGVTTATYTTSALTVATHPITATYGGDSNYTSSSSGPALDQVVNKVVTTTSVGSSLNPSTSGQSVTFTATVAPASAGLASPSGTVTFYDNGVSIGSGAVSTSGGVTTATLSISSLAIGTHPITATYGGDSDYSGSSSSPALSQVVNGVGVATTTKLASSLNPSLVGQSVTLTATITKSSGTGNPTGTVTFKDNGTSIGSGAVSTSGGVTTATLSTSTLAVGTHPITASYSGDGSYSGSTTGSPLSQVVDQISTTASVKSSLNPSTVGQSVTFTATVSPGVAGPVNPTGTVTFYDNGTSIGSGAVSTAGGVTTATYTTSTLTAATHPITAGYGGDADYAASTSSPALDQVVNKVGTSTSLASSVNPAAIGQTITYTATVSPVPDGGTVAFTDGGASISGCGSVTVDTSTGRASCQVSYGASGSHAIVAAYSGDAAFAGSQSGPLTQNVSPSSTPVTSHQLSVTDTGNGSGAVTSAPAGIDCGSTCAATFSSGTVVTLTAAAGAGSTFSGWSGAGCSGTGTCTVTMSSAQAVTATFTVAITGQTLACGVQHRGLCEGIKTKTLFTGPGNAVWTFYLFNPARGTAARAASPRLLRLGTVRRTIKKRGAVTVTFLLRGRTMLRLIAQGRKQHLTAVGVTTTFTTKTGRRTTTTRTLKVKLP